MCSVHAYTYIGYERTWWREKTVGDHRGSGIHNTEVIRTSFRVPIMLFHYVLYCHLLPSLLHESPPSAIKFKFDPLSSPLCNSVTATRVCAHNDLHTTGPCVTLCIIYMCVCARVCARILLCSSQDIRIYRIGRMHIGIMWRDRACTCAHGRGRFGDRNERKFTRLRSAAPYSNGI
jgi:hypothetical protein